jgi:hypothetical protein
VEFVRQGCAGRQRVVSQEPDDFGNVTNEWGGFVAFPIADGQGVYANFVCDLFLEELEVQAPPAEVVS